MVTTVDFQRHSDAYGTVLLTSLAKVLFAIVFCFKWKYSRLLLSRTSRDLIKMFKLSVVRDNQIVTS